MEIIIALVVSSLISAGTSAYLSKKQADDAKEAAKLTKSKDTRSQEAIDRARRRQMAAAGSAGRESTSIINPTSSLGSVNQRTLIS